jgi:phospholipid/cholesterol/gamma-HCH transport system permease protein
VAIDFDTFTQKYLRLPEQLSYFLSESGAIFRFAMRYAGEVFRAPWEYREFIHQCYVIGVKSFGLIAVTGFIMGLVLTMQLRPSMVSYGVESQMPVMVSLALVREIGPVITALIFAGKISSGIGAELGSMKVTEQIDAMEVSGTNPFKYLVVTRILACTIMLPLLTLLSDAVSLYGSWIGINIKGHTSLSLYFFQVFQTLKFGDVIPAVIKTVFFGYAIGLIGSYKGYYSQRGTEGVGRAANAAVVIASLLIFIIDLLTVQITDLFGLN